MGNHHGSPKSAEDRGNRHGIGTQLMQVNRLEVQEHSLANTPGEKGNGNHDETEIHVFCSITLCTKSALVKLLYGANEITFKAS